MMQRLNGLNNGYVGGSPEVPSCSISCGVITPKKLHINALEINQWERPDYWLSLPQINAGEQKFAGLFAVFKGASGNTGATADSNFAAIRMIGNFIVDWGNGITRAYASNTTAAYTYNFEDISSTTETPQGFRQVIIQAYPQTGATLTSLILSDTTGFSFGTNLTGLAGLTLPTNTTYEWLDVKISGASLSTLTLGNACAHMHKFEYVGRSSLTSIASMFDGCYSLERFVGTEWTSNVTNMSRAFQNCWSLRTLPLLDTQNVTTWFSCFFQAYAFHTVPCFNTSKTTTTYQMFRTCYSLNDVPRFDMRQVTDCVQMFENCKSIESIPMFDIRSVRLMDSMVSGSGIKKFPMLDTSGVTSMSGLFLNCPKLKEIPLLNTSQATSFAFFVSGSGVEIIPDIDTSKGRNFASFARLATCLKRVPKMSFAGVTGPQGNTPVFQEMFFRCRSLLQIPEWDLSSVNHGPTSLGVGSTGPFNVMFNDMGQIRVLGLKGLQRSIDLSNMTLSPTELNTFFTNLGGVTLYGGSTINITNVWGATAGAGYGVTCNRSIATSKGWTIIG
jgi:hypothetical protein